MAHDVGDDDGRHVGPHRYVQEIPLSRARLVYVGVPDAGEEGMLVVKELAVDEVTLDLPRLGEVAVERQDASI